MANPIEELFSLRGKVALVTGGRKGLGLEITRVLGQAGAKVFISGRSPAAARWHEPTPC